MKTLITVEQFASALNGASIIDANKNHWVFVNNPTGVGKSPYLAKRMLKPPFEHPIEELTYTDLYGKNNIMDEECGVIIELNAPEAKIQDM